MAAEVHPGRGRAQDWIGRLASGATVCAALGIWELLGRTSSLRQTLPPFTTVARWLAHAIVTAGFWSAMGHTMLQWLLGLILGTVVGIVVGLFIGISEPLRLTLDAVIDFLRPIPAIVYLPLLILIYGNTDTLATVNVSVGVVFILIFQAYYGTRAIDPTLVDTGRIFGLSYRQRLLRLVLPSISPYIATGVRIASSTAMLIGVSVELIGAAPGLGLSIGYAQQNGEYPAMYGYVLVTGLVAVVMNVALVRGESYLLAWHPSQRRQLREQ